MRKYTISELWSSSPSMQDQQMVYFFDDDDDPEELMGCISIKKTHLTEWFTA